MKTLSNTHLTANQKKAIKAIIDAGLQSGKVGRTNYFIAKTGENTYDVIIKVMDRGMGFIGDKLRLSTYKHTVQI